MAGVVLLLLPCLAGSASLKVPVEAVLGAVELADQKSTRACMDGPSVGVTFANITLSNSIERYTTSCMLDLLKTTFTLRTTCLLFGSQTRYPKFPLGP